MSNAPAAPILDSKARALRQVLRKPKVAISACVLLIILFSAFVIPFLIPAALQNPSSAQYQPPSWTHLFGTDLLGRDLFYRVLIGARISLIVGILGALLSFLVGTSVGLISGYAGGRIDNIMMRMVDILHAIPRLIVIILFVHAADEPVRNQLKMLSEWLVAQNLANSDNVRWLVDYSRIGLLIISLGMIEWLTMARIVRGQVLSVRNLQFVTAARALGQRHIQIMLRHILPNIMGIVIVYLTLTIPAVILDEAFLSFLGLGVDASQASWGTLLSDGAQAINPIQIYWWLIVFPGVAMSLTLLSLNFLGDGLRDVFDPKD